MTAATAADVGKHLLHCRELALSLFVCLGHQHIDPSHDVGLVDLCGGASVVKDSR